MNNPQQPEALRLAELFEIEDDPDSLYRQAAAELRRLHEVNQELMDALRRMCGAPDDPNNGWRGTGGTEVLFACEFCGKTHEDCTQIDHKTRCPVIVARAAIAKAEGESK